MFFNSLARRTVTAMAIVCTASTGVAMTQIEANATGATRVGPPSAGVLYPGCYDQSWSYAVDPAQAGYDWAIFVKAVDPSGREEASGSVWKDEGAAPSGFGEMQICSDDLPGTWTLNAEIHFYGGPYDDEVLPSTTFTLREALSKTSLRASTRSARLGQNVRLKVRSLVEQPNGYFPSEYGSVVVQQRVGGVWRKVGTASLDDNGGGSVILRWAKPTGKVTFRALTKSTDDFVGSESPKLAVRTSRA